eukprot:TRINITY_DN37461_c0_g1_i1.p1 TRINITY_DN37461_c0_g1~~TRINITY_DN37461_c0_g1_i1.p1  ORF type:complete len:694 (-),score=252.55 TRINITY_DN37461_c0_g1_i1:136-2217(-)
MADKDYAPLSTACVRALNDRLYEKRKAAALEIEKMVKDFVSVGNTSQIKKLLKVLGSEFAISQNPHMRKGGLIGLAAMAIGLGKETGVYTEDLIMPILTCLSDADSRVRYYACESLYNVVKVSRESVLPMFNEIFSSISCVVADPDQNVKNGSELLDRLLKDIVTESKKFDVESFVPILRERMYTRDRFVRQFLVSWISVLDSVPDARTVKYLPEFLDPLFNILDDSSPEISTMCDNLLGEFLGHIIDKPELVDFAGMINILINHSQSPHVPLQMMAVTWIREFVTLAGSAMLPFTSGILTAVLPCLAYDDEERRTVREMSRTVNSCQMKLVKSETVGESVEEKHKLDLSSVMEVLTKQLQRGTVQSKVAALKWIYHLFIQIPVQMFQFIDDIFPVLLKTLSDHSDEVVILDLEVLAEISSSKIGRSNSTDTAGTSPHFKQFILSLLKLFSADRNLLEAKGSFIIRQLCVLLSSEDIYRSISELLVLEDNLKFARLMVETLSTILLTSSELFELRTKLKELNSKDSCHLFCCLYQTWCHSQIATVALCLLAGCYGHAGDLIRLIGEQEVTVEMLTELDRLVQLLESPIFTFLRMELLDGDNELISALYGLLMLLPQSEAFSLVKGRLACVPHVQKQDKHRDARKSKKKKFMDEIDFPSLLEHFQDVVTKHQMARRKDKTSAMLAKGGHSINIS